MRKSNRLPARFPAGTKYVLESCGAVIRRFIELPNGRQIALPDRKAEACCAADATLVPRLEPATVAPRARAKHNSRSRGRSRVLAAG